MPNPAGHPTAFVDRSRTAPLSGPIGLPPPFVGDAARPEHYVMDKTLEDAANTALALGQPLLLTGDPGTGKTRFAHYLAWQLGLGAPLEFHTKSSSVASDLFYTYDTVRRFHAAHIGSASVDERDYIHYNALGLAVLLSLSPAATAHLRTPGDDALRAGPRRSVVLIDEIDKASRDFPNDLLHELSTMTFRIPELNASIAADPAYRPIVVVTSNRERPLPDAFLRRCVYHNIDYPDRQRLIDILCTRFGHEHGTPPPLVTSAVDLFKTLEPDLVRAPSTAELVAWFSLVSRSEHDLGRRVQDLGDRLQATVSALAKTADDRRVVARHLGLPTA